MAKKIKLQKFTGIEIGTDKVKVVIAEIPEDADRVSVLGAGCRPSLKVQKGDILDIGIVTEQVELAMGEAEDQAGLEINDTIVFMAVTGGHFSSVNCIGNTFINAEDGKVTEDDLVAAVKVARNYRLPPEMNAVHAIDRFYRVDNGPPIANPLGQIGNKLEAYVHIIYANRNRLQTACKIILDTTGDPARDIAFSGIASAYGVCSKPELEAGSLVLDIGAGVTEYAAFHNAGCYHSGQVTVGCDHCINDLAIGLRLPLQKAELLLLDLQQMGSAVMHPDGRKRLVEVEHLGRKARNIPVSTVERIIELRFQELFKVILQDLQNHDVLPLMSSGIFITGGGALIPGIDSLARQVFNRPVRIASPRLPNGAVADDEDVVNSPIYATVIGLIRLGKMFLDVAEPEPEPAFGRYLKELRGLGSKLREAFSL